jgi:glycosyltransferase involved in cell wall biosynthesis
MDTKDIAVIMRKLNDPDPEVRRMAIESLSAEDLTDALVRMLVHKLEDENKGVRDAAFQILKNSHHPSLPKQLSPFFYYRDLEIKNIAVDIMVELGEMAIPELIEILDTSDPDAQKSAAEVMNIIKSHQAVDALLKHIDDPDPNVGFACIEALGTIGDFKAIQPLIEVFKNNEDLRGVAIESLGKILSRRIPDELFNGLHSEDPIVVFSVIEAFGKIKDTTALEKLIEIFPYHDEIIQQEILKSISNIITSSKYILLPTHLLEPGLSFYKEADLSEKEKYLNLFSRISSERALDTLLQAYQLSEEEDWQEKVFHNIVNFFLLFPAQVMELVFSADDPEYRMYLLSHMPYTGLPEYYEFLDSYYERVDSEEEKQTILYYLLQFNLPQVDQKMKKILSDPASKEHVVLIEIFHEKEISPYLDVLQANMIKYSPELQEAYMNILVNQAIPELHRQFESIESALSHKARLLLYSSKESLEEKDYEFLKSYLTQDEESIRNVVKILLHADHTFYPKELEALWDTQDWQLQNSLAKLYVHKYESHFKNFLLHAAKHPSFFLTILAELEESSYEFSPELLEAVWQELDESLQYPFVRYFLVSGKEHSLTWLRTHLESTKEDELDALINYFINEEQYDLLQTLSSLIRIPDQLKEKYARYLNE